MEVFIVIDLSDQIVMGTYTKLEDAQAYCSDLQGLHPTDEFIVVMDMINTTYGAK